MYVLQADSVNGALIQGLSLLLRNGERSDSRNGTVLTVPYPVTTMTRNPHQRVLSIPGRGDNPFFHFLESLWMLAGRKDLKPLATVVSRMASYSDDGGKTQPGAYGFRWRKHFNIPEIARDQLMWAIGRLIRDPNDRRVVIGMWDPVTDIPAADRGGKDVPCNTHIYLLIRNGQLDMTVCCRSNDAVWGAHGANAVHFSVLQEFIASCIGCELGALWQVSNNYHLYEAILNERLIAAADMNPATVCRYALGLAEPRRLMDGNRTPQEWLEDLEMWWDEPTKVGLRHSFFRRTATPIIMAHRAWMDKRNDERHEQAMEIIRQCDASDWREAGLTWLKASQERHNRAKDDGPIEEGRD